MSKKQKLFRRVLTLFLALIMVLGCVAMIAPFIVSADDGNIDFDDLIAAGRGGYCGENATWKLNGRGVLTIGGTGAMDLKGQTAPWYPHKDEITSIVVEDGITAICDSAFMNLFYVESVSIGMGVQSIGEYAFNALIALTGVVIPDNVETIGSEAFGMCNKMKSVVIGDGVTFIDYYAFMNCDALETATIGAGYTDFDPDIFEMCPKLKSITVESGNKAYASENGAVYSKDMTALVYIPSGIAGSFAIPSTVTQIRTGALEHSYGLTSVTIPASVKKIEEQSVSDMGAVETVYYTGTAAAWEKIEKINCEDFFEGKMKFVASLKITKQPTNASAAAGKRVETSLTATGDGLTYAWYIQNKGQTTWGKSSLTGNTYYVAEMKSTVDGRKVYCVVTDKYGNSVKSNTVTLTMTGATTQNTAKITKQPTNAAAANGKRVETSLTATGDGLKYQWYFKNKGASTWGTSSLTGNTYYVNMASHIDGRQVYCVVTDKYGNTVKSNTVTLTMTGATTQATAKITKQPTNAAAANGKRVETSLTATGDGLKYQWYFKNKGASTWGTSSLTGNTYYVNMASHIDGRQVYCQITDKYGNTVKSNTVTLTMTGATTQATAKITKQPTNAAAANGKRVETSLTATGDGLKYQWYFKNKGATTWGTSSLTGNTYYVNMASHINGRQVYCVVTDKYGNTVKSNTVTLTMTGATTQATAKITKQPTNAAAANGKRVETSLTATGDGLKYQWYFKNKGATTWGTSSLTGNTYYVNMASHINGRQVYCVVTDKYGNTVKSNTVTLTMAQELKVEAMPWDVAAAENERISVILTATGDGLKYQWYIRNDGVETWSKSSLTGNEYYVDMKSHIDGRQIYCVVTDKYGNSVKSNVVTLHMESADPIALDLSSGHWACVTEPRNGKLNQYFMVASNENEAYLLVYAYTTDASQDADINEPIVIDDVTYYNYGAEEHRMNFVRSGNTFTMTGTKTNASLVVKLQEDYSMVLQSVSGVLNCEIMKAGDAFEFEAYPVYVEYITKQPENAVGDYGDVLTATVETEGEDLTYQWYIWQGGDWVPTDQTTPTYTMTLSEGNVGQTVYCRVTDAEGEYQDSFNATFDYLAPSAWGTFRYVKPTADNAYLVVAELNVERRELHVQLWEPLAAGEEPDEIHDLAADGIYYREPGEGFWRNVEMSVEDGLVKIAILEADEEVAAIYLERTDYYTMTTVRATGTINDIPGFVEMFAEGDLVTWY